jgi:hypothetical protein
MLFALTNFYFFCVFDNILSFWLAILMVVSARITMRLEGDGF